MTILSPGFWTPILVTVGLNAMVACGVYVTLLSGQASVAHGALMGIGAYLAAVLTTKFGLPFPIAIASAILCAGVIGALLSLVTMRMSELVVALTTIGFGETAVVIAFNADYIGGAQSFSGIPLKTTISLIYAALVLVAYVTWRIDHSRLGLGARAIRDNRLAAEAMGIDVPRVRVWTFAIGAAMAGLAGALAAHYFLVINPNDLSFFQSFVYKVFVLFGGSYVFVGPIVGSAILTILPELLRFTAHLPAFGSDSLRFIAYGIVIVVVIILRPTGLVSRIRSGSPTPRWLALPRRLWRRTRGSSRGSVVKSADRISRLSDTDD